MKKIKEFRDCCIGEVKARKGPYRFVSCKRRATIHIPSKRNPGVTMNFCLICGNRYQKND